MRLAHSQKRDQGTLRQICRVIASQYGTPDLGNLSDPIDELVYIVTTFKTNESNYQKVFQDLKEAFTDWESLIVAPVERVKSIMKSAGLSNQKAPRLKSILQRIKMENGTLSLEFLNELPDDEIEAYLLSFPGVGKKGARCIMLYSLERKVLPVDTHTIRIFKRLGYVDWSTNPKSAQDTIQEMVPADIRRELHVNLVAHGRVTCKARQPSCDSCCIQRHCNAYKTEYFGPVKE